MICTNLVDKGVQYMSVGVRDKIQHLQLSILQDYLEIKMKIKYGDKWKSNIIAHCENKVANNDQRKQTYKKVVDEKRNKGAVMVTKKSFDITLLNALLQFDFPNDCCADPSDVQVFKNYIRDITNNKNDLASHISDLEDTYYIDKLERESLLNLRNFILYLERLGWGFDGDAQRVFIEKYNGEICKLDEELSGPKVLQKVNVSISVKDKFDNFIPGYRLKILNDENQTVTAWTSSNEIFSVLVDVGQYRIESIKEAKGYKDIAGVPFSALKSETEKAFVMIAERFATNEELYIEAFDYLSDVKQYSRALSLLEELEKANFMEAILLLSFLLEKGICGLNNAEKAQELLMFAGFQEDELTWKQKAETLQGEGKWKSAISYFLAFSMKNGSGEGFFQAARILLLKVKNYELCKECFKLAISCGVQEAEKPYDFICKIGKAEYMKLKGD